MLPTLRFNTQTIYLAIIDSLRFLDKNEDFENEFSNISSDLFCTIRSRLFQTDLQKLGNEVYQLALQEAGLSF